MFVLGKYLQPNKFYLLEWDYNGHIKWYFKCSKIYDNFIYNSGYYVDIVYKKSNNKKFISLDIDSNRFKEVCISEFVDLLPDDNIDKITYLRKKKIALLCSIMN